jgi:cytochrome c6
MVKYVLGLVLSLGLWLGLSTGVLAADVAQGAKVFQTNCAACHMGGGNVVNAMKTLKQADLETYGMNSLDAIQTQVTNGKAAMPAFRGRLSDADIENVAAYVLEQAAQGW